MSTSSINQQHNVSYSFSPSSTSINTRRLTRWRGARRWMSLEDNNGWNNNGNHSTPSSRPHDIVGEQSHSNVTASPGLVDTQHYQHQERVEQQTNVIHQSKQHKRTTSSSSSSSLSSSDIIISAIPDFIVEHMGSGGDTAGLLLLIEHELHHLLLSLGSIRDREEEITLVGCSMSLSSFLRRCVHETAKRFLLPSRSIGVVDERRLHVFADSESIPPVLMYADFLTPITRRQCLESLCTHAKLFFRTQDNCDYVVPEMRQDFLCLATPPGTPLALLSSAPVLSIERITEKNDKSLASVQCSTKHMVILKLHITLDEISDEFIDEMLCLAGWIFADETVDDRLCYRTELFRAFNVCDCSSAVLICWSAHNATASIDSLHEHPCIAAASILSASSSSSTLEALGLFKPTKRKHGDSSVSSRTTSRQSSSFIAGRGDKSMSWRRTEQ